MQPEARLGMLRDPVEAEQAREKEAQTWYEILEQRLVDSC